MQRYTFLDYILDSWKTFPVHANVSGIQFYRSDLDKYSSRTLEMEKQMGKFFMLLTLKLIPGMMSSLCVRARDSFEKSGPSLGPMIFEVTINRKTQIY